VGLGEVAVKRLTVGPFLDRDEAQRVLDGGEEAVAQAPLLAARVVLHPFQQDDQLIAPLWSALDPTDYKHHA